MWLASATIIVLGVAGALSLGWIARTAAGEQTETWSLSRPWTNPMAETGQPGAEGSYSRAVDGLDPTSMSIAASGGGTSFALAEPPEDQETASPWRDDAGEDGGDSTREIHATAERELSGLREINAWRHIFAPAPWSEPEPPRAFDARRENIAGQPRGAPVFEPFPSSPLSGDDDSIGSDWRILLDSAMAAEGTMASSQSHADFPGQGLDAYTLVPAAGRSAFDEALADQNGGNLNQARP